MLLAYLCKSGMTMRGWIAGVGCLLFAVSALAANQPATVFTEEMTWKEIRDAIRSGAHTVIIPTGGTEQNGLHMVTGKHNYIVHYTAERIARELGGTLVAPVIAYVPEGAITPPQGHMQYAGTISVSDETFERLLADTARSFRQHGFTRICFIGDHGGSQAPQQRVAEALSREWQKEGVKVIQVSEYYSSANGQDEWLSSQGEQMKDIQGHGGLSDTSELLAVSPSGVRTSFLGAPVNADNGAGGSPLHASKAYGQHLLELKIAAAVRQIRKAENNPPSAE